MGMVAVPVKRRVCICCYCPSSRNFGFSPAFAEPPYEETDYVPLLRRCSASKSLPDGRLLHARIVASGQDQEDTLLGNLLLQMYARCRSSWVADALFAKMQRNVFSWNIIIDAYAQGGDGREIRALRLFWRMVEVGDCKPDRFTFTSALSAATHTGTLDQGKKIHSRVVASGIDPDVLLDTALINMYGKARFLTSARAAFDRIPHPDLISWNAIIDACAQNEDGIQALHLFRKMNSLGTKPNRVTFLAILEACACLSSLEIGRAIHRQMVNGGIKLDVALETALLNMYGKCGSASDAQWVFDNMQQHDVISWNSMMVVYAQYGHGQEALALLRQMVLTGVEPNRITFINILNACSHAGLLEEGRNCFISMIEYGSKHLVEHFRCMLDMLGRVGCLEEAEALLLNMPIKPDVLAWIMLLGACRVYVDVERGTRAAVHALELDPNHASPYVLLSNLYAAVGKWDDVAKVRQLMEHRGVKKPPGCSWIEVNYAMHGFFAEDSSHPQYDEIKVELQRLNKRLKEVGYVPDTRAVLHNLKEDEKERMLWCHSEKLALAFGLVATPAGTPLRIVKNLRVCSDCHTVIKLVSGICGREIIVRDANRFHHFKEGVCSCGEYW